MADPHPREHARPALTVDVVLIAGDHVLLIQRRNPPFRGRWALPGGFVDEGERLEDAARRELVEETGLAGLALEQLGAYGDPGRDPRGWVVSVVYLAACERDAVEPRAGDDAASVRWFPLSALPELAFDHADILRDAVSARRSTP